LVVVEEALRYRQVGDGEVEVEEEEVVIESMWAKAEHVEMDDRM
jgi:hypothetical protein